ncbi:MAG: type 3 dihydrofolate reductase [Gammaproteobacteria bacterium]|nr:type 3 dihydrofolate reductase [Gammaproteobacteria bacterium]
MIISLIAAMADNRVIGIDNTLPWRLPADLKHFKKITLGKPILMGRKTYESIGKPLPERTNIIVTADRDYQAPGCVVVHSIDEALAACGNSEETMVIGGASFYEQLLPRADRLYLTLIHENFAGDAWFPAYDPAQWQEIERTDHQPDEANPYRYSFVVMKRSPAH